MYSTHSSQSDDEAAAVSCKCIGNYKFFHSLRRPKVQDSQLDRLVLLAKTHVSMYHYMTEGMY